jgi:hypothetical protein
MPAFEVKKISCVDSVLYEMNSIWAYMYDGDLARPFPEDVNIANHLLSQCMNEISCLTLLCKILLRTKFESEETRQQVRRAAYEILMSLELRFENCDYPDFIPERLRILGKLIDEGLK